MKVAICISLRAPSGVSDSFRRNLGFVPPKENRADGMSAVGTYRTRYRYPDGFVDRYHNRIL